MKRIYLFILPLFISFSIIAQQTEKTDYFMSKTINASFEKATEHVKKVLKEQQFGVITEIDMHEKLAEKMPDLEMKRYRILGACNPMFAYDALQAEENIGLFLPCKILIKEVDKNTTEVVMIDPAAVMGMLQNPRLTEVANEVTNRFKNALDNL